MGTSDILLGGGGGPCGVLVSLPGGSSNTPGHASCDRNRYKLWPFGPLAHHLRLYCTFIRKGVIFVEG